MPGKFIQHNNRSGSGRHYLRTLVISVAFGISLFLPNIAFSETETLAIQLTAKPARCVALHEGQDCYLNLNLGWSSSVQGNYCLYIKGDGKTLHCWENARSGKYKINFKSSRSVVYVLRGGDGDGLSVETVVTVSWVYSSNTRKTNWRLF